MTKEKLDSHRYDDMLYLPRPISPKHPPMPALSRASIFSPYAALSGYEGQILAAQHHRCNKLTLSEDELLPIHDALSNLKKHDFVSVTYFYHSPGSDGSGGFAEGEYINTSGEVLSINRVFHSLRIGTAQNWIDIDFEDLSRLEKLVG